MSDTPREIANEVIDAYGGVDKVQARFSYKSPMGVYLWRRRGIPRSLIADIHLDTGIPLERLKVSEGAAA